MASWQQKYRVDGLGRYRWQEWGSPANSVGNVDGNGEILLQKGFRAGQPPGGLGLGDRLQYPKEDLAGALRLFGAPEEGAV